MATNFYFVPARTTGHCPQRKYFKMMGALAFVPEDDVRRMWRLLKPLIPDDMLQFVSYYETTWIGTSAADPLFFLGSVELPRLNADASATQH